MSEESAWRKRPMALNTIGAMTVVQFGLVLAAAVLPWPTTGESGVGQGEGASDAARALLGAVDIHVHNLPDDRPRSIDAIDVAKLASMRGMRAIVLKNHYEQPPG